MSKSMDFMSMIFSLLSRLACDSFALLISLTSIFDSGTEN